MSLPRRRRGRPAGRTRLALTGDFPGTDQDITEALPRADWDGRTYQWGGASSIGIMPAPAPVAAAPDTAPPARLRAEPRYQPPDPAPAGYADTTGPMPAIGRPAVSIGDALTRDETWGPKLAPLPCGHCGTPPPVPDGILDRTRIIGHVNWLAGQAGWKFDTDLIFTCPPCQQDDAWKARQGQMEVRPTLLRAADANNSLRLPRHGPRRRCHAHIQGLPRQPPGAPDPRTRTCPDAGPAMGRHLRTSPPLIATSPMGRRPAAAPPVWVAQQISTPVWPSPAPPAESR
jgi:hypothetical protein